MGGNIEKSVVNDELPFPSTRPRLTVSLLSGVARFRRMDWLRFILDQACNVGFAAGGVGNRCNSAIEHCATPLPRSRDASDRPTTMTGLAVTLAFSLVAFTTNIRLGSR